MKNNKYGPNGCRGEPRGNVFNAVRSIDADRLKEEATCQRAKHLKASENEIKCIKDDLPVFFNGQVYRHRQVKRMGDLSACIAPESVRNNVKIGS